MNPLAWIKYSVDLHRQELKENRDRVKELRWSISTSWASFTDFLCRKSWGITPVGSGLKRLVGPMAS